MQTVFNKLKQHLTLKVILPLSFSFLLTSCFYSGKYIAAYSVQDKNKDKNTREITIDFINQLADKYALSNDSEFNDIDTLGFFGQPYHYFKFWFEQKDTNTIVKLDYWGTFGSRKKKPYKDFFNELDDFMKETFIIIDQDVKEENNSKKK